MTEDELAAELFRKMEHLDPTADGDPELEDWGWAKLSPRRKDFYRMCVRYILLLAK